MACRAQTGVADRDAGFETCKRDMWYGQHTLARAYGEHGIGSG